MQYNNERELYLDILNHRKRAFHFLYSEYRPKAIRMLTGNNSSEQDAMDIFQEAVIALWSNIQEGKYQFRSGTKLSSYLLQICKYKLYDRFKSAHSKYAEPLEEQLELNDPGQNPLDQLLSKEEVEQASLTFSRLNENCQQLLRLFYFEKLSMPQLAERLGIKVTSATNQKYRCMQRLGDLITDIKEQES